MHFIADAVRKGHTISSTSIGSDRVEAVNAAAATWGKEEGGGGGGGGREGGEEGGEFEMDFD